MFMLPGLRLHMPKGMPRLQANLQSMDVDQKDASLPETASSALMVCRSDCPDFLCNRHATDKTWEAPRNSSVSHVSYPDGPHRRC